MDLKQGQQQQQQQTQLQVSDASSASNAAETLHLCYPASRMLRMLLLGGIRFSDE